MVGTGVPYKQTHYLEAGKAEIDAIEMQGLSTDSQAQGRLARDRRGCVSRWRSRVSCAVYLTNLLEVCGKD